MISVFKVKSTSFLNCIFTKGRMFFRANLMRATFCTAENLNGMWFMKSTISDKGKNTPRARP